MRGRERLGAGWADAFADAEVIAPNAAGVGLLVCSDELQVRLASQLFLTSRLFATVREQYPTLRCLIPVSGLVYDHVRAGTLRLQ